MMKAKPKGKKRIKVNKRKKEKVENNVKLEVGDFDFTGIQEMYRDFVSRDKTNLKDNVANLSFSEA